MPWAPARYEQFKRERSAPVDDLLALLRIRPGLRVIDLGAGTGELTRRLADALPGSVTLGVDSSAEMLERSGAFAGPELSFEQRSIDDVLATAALCGQFDVVFSNAALHWLPDHRSVVPRVFGLLAPGGQMLVQVPSNHEHPTQVLLRELAASEPYAAALGGDGREVSVLRIGDYAELLHAAGASSITVFEKVYPHVLDGSGALADWMAGTTLVPFRERLGEPLGARFFEDYRALLGRRFGDGPVFFGFQRIIWSACRSE